MKVTILDWRDEPFKQKEEKGEVSNYLLKVGYGDLSMIALDINSRGIKPLGLIPPYDLDHLTFTFRCMATVRDHFPDFAVYAPVPKWCPREVIRSAKGAGFRHFVLQFVDPWAFQHQVVHDLLESAKGVHVAGGDPKVEEWTWSEEQL